MRTIVYGLLIALAALVVGDTHVGRSISDDQTDASLSAVRHLRETQFYPDARLASQIVESDGFRESRLFAALSAYGKEYGLSTSFYAYTPIFSRSRVFLGDHFWDIGDVGRASILLHELAHVVHHRNRILRGIPRHLDEAQAYLRQYTTYEEVGLDPHGDDGIVFWDMMIGVETYVVPLYPDYAERDDIRWAIGELNQEVDRPVADVAVIVAYAMLTGLVLVGGDRIGARIACAILGRCRRFPPPHFGEWTLIPIGVLIPSLILVGFTVLMVDTTRNAFEAFINNFELALLGAFFLTGLLGGFLTQKQSEAG